MSKYVCPICGKSYENAKDMAACATKCAIKIEENDKAKVEKAEIMKSLKTTRNEIDKLYNEILTKVRDYNKLGEKLNCLDNKSAMHCTASLCYDNNLNGFENIKDIFPKKETATNSDMTSEEALSALDKVIDEAIERAYDKMTMDDLIKSIFNF